MIHRRTAPFNTTSSLHRLWYACRLFRQNLRNRHFRVHLGLRLAWVGVGVTLLRRRWLLRLLLNGCLLLARGLLLGLLRLLRLLLLRCGLLGIGRRCSAGGSRCTGCLLLTSSLLLRLRLRIAGSVSSPLVRERYSCLVTERSTRSSGIRRLRCLTIRRLTSSGLRGLLVLSSIVRKLGTLLRLELSLRLLSLGVLVRGRDAIRSGGSLLTLSSSTGVARLCVLIRALGIAVVADDMLPPETLDPLRCVVMSLLLLSLLLIDPLHLFLSKRFAFLVPLLCRRFDSAKPILCKIHGHEGPTISSSQVVDMLLLLRGGFVVELG